MKPIARLFAAFAIIAPSPTLASDASITLGMTVPRICYLAPTGGFTSGAGYVQLSNVREFCNGDGYVIMLDYTPGTLVGATATFADQRVVLDGSGEAVLLDANYAVSRVSTLVIERDGVEREQSRVQLRMGAR